MDRWDPAQYERFKRERAAPFHDLLALLRPVPGGRIVDLGCGTGELTCIAHDSLGATKTIGIDNSAAMLREARAREHAGVEFDAGDIAAFGGDLEGAFDVVLSNAALQWVPDHSDVIKRWASTLAAGGQLAVQVPANADHPSHATAVEVAHESEFAGDFDGTPPVDPVRSVLDPEEYACLLADLGFREPHVRLQVYGHWLPRTEDVVEWVKGTSLVRFRRVLPEARYEAFVGRYRARLLDVLGDRRPFFYPFKRILLWAEK